MTSAEEGQPETTRDGASVAWLPAGPLCVGEDGDGGRKESFAAVLWPAALAAVGPAARQRESSFRDASGGLFGRTGECRNCTGTPGSQCAPRHASSGPWRWGTAWDTGCRRTSSHPAPCEAVWKA